MAAKKYKRKMLISVLPGEQVELILTEDGKIQEYYVEMLHQVKTKGNIYKGFIHNVDNPLQAAFINYGAEKNGFLQIDEVHPDYYQGSYPMSGHRFPLIQKIMKAGQEVLVQVVKEPTGSKGAFLTTYLSLPGRYFVLTPGREQLGISRKIEDEKERKRLKKIVTELSPGEGVGVIVRTVSQGQSKTDLKTDMTYLKRLWKDIRKKATTHKPPSMVYKDLNLAARAVRDFLTSDVGEVWLDDQETASEVTELVKLAFPRRKSMVKLHDNPKMSLWERFSLAKQVEEIYSRTVTLPSGGQLVIDQTEALTAIDINSGRIAGKRNFKEMAFKSNVEAAEEIARQLRLRDIGGQVVIDFIEMKDSSHVREVEKTMRAALKTDRARTDMSRISRFGLMQVVRQRMGLSAISTSTELCPHCEGRGVRRNLEWQAIAMLKKIFMELKERAQDPKALGGRSVKCKTTPELAHYLQNFKRNNLLEMEKSFGTKVFVSSE
jgi:ribonuclease E